MYLMAIDSIVVVAVVTYRKNKFWKTAAANPGKF